MIRYLSEVGVQEEFHVLRGDSFLPHRQPLSQMPPATCSEYPAPSDKIIFLLEFGQPGKAFISLV